MPIAAASPPGPAPITMILQQGLLFIRFVSLACVIIALPLLAAGVDGLAGSCLLSALAASTRLWPSPDAEVGTVLVVSWV